MNQSVKVARIHNYGGPEVLVFEDIELAPPGPGQVLVRNRVLGLNFVDVYYRRGTFPVAALPAVLGNEAAGVVEAVGEGVTQVKVGDRVGYCDDINGSYATARLYEENRLIPLPASISDAQAASVMLKGLTARYLLKEVLPIKAGDTVLYHAAAGGVGQIFSQWGKALGINVIGTVSDDRKAEVARKNGCAHVINYRTEDFVSRVMEITGGRGVRAVFDSVGKDTFKGSLKVLETRGMVVVFGKASGDLPDINPFELAPRSLQLAWPILPSYVDTREKLVESAGDLFEAIASGHVKADPETSYPFDRLVEAHRALEDRQTIGATVLTL
ncbi:MAG TPA: quinone oxidoreductase [Telluria sp.]